MSTDNWGSVARFGIFIVGAEVVPEAEWWAMSPPGVSIHAARVTTSTPWAKWTNDRNAVTLAPDLERGAAQFASMALSAVVLCANDPVGAWGGVQLLRENFEIEPTVVTGPATDNAVGIEIIEQRSNVPAINALTNGAELGDLIQSSLGIEIAQAETGS